MVNIASVNESKVWSYLYEKGLFSRIFVIVSLRSFVGWIPKFDVPLPSFPFDVFGLESDGDSGFHSNGTHRTNSMT